MAYNKQTLDEIGTRQPRVAHKHEAYRLTPVQSSEIVTADELMTQAEYWR